MLEGIGLLAIIFALVPGYIADLGFRACWGMAKGDEFDRSLRAIVWTVLGLVIYAAIWKDLPDYVYTVTKEGAQTPTADSGLANAFAIHVLLSSIAAFFIGALSSWTWARDKFTRVFRRSPTFEAPWDLLATMPEDRKLRVVTKNGERYIGRARMWSHRSDEKELVLYDPSRESSDGHVEPLPVVRLIYLPGDEIREIQLSYTVEEFYGG